MLTSPRLLPFLLSIPLVLPSLTGSISSSARLSLLSSGLALQQPRCAIRGQEGDWPGSLLPGWSHSDTANVPAPAYPVHADPGPWPARLQLSSPEAALSSGAPRLA